MAVIYHDTVENLDFLTLAVSHSEQSSVSGSSASCIPFTVCSDSPNVSDQRYLCSPFYVNITALLEVGKNAQTG